jgi:predicted hotdog family 3-hydroxylacyl-ACP dehydratase
MTGLEAYLPHRAPMILVDRIIALSAEEVITEVSISETSPFFNGQGVGAWVGMEYMAQTIGVLGGYLSSLQGDAIKIGFLLGTRRYEAHCALFKVGMVLRVKAQLELQASNGLWSFACVIEEGKTQQLLAKANLKVYQPESLDSIKQG